MQYVLGTPGRESLSHRSLYLSSLMRGADIGRAGKAALHAPPKPCNSRSDACQAQSAEPLQEPLQVLNPRSLSRAILMMESDVHLEMTDSRNMGIQIRTDTHTRTYDTT